ncbi:MAG: AAA family ATPase [Lachnospiraceae bacterium]|nr:AAA family ATPase [Lachnospiraceae bacterium]
MDNQKKVLTRIQLINWHYFENERISINGSTLVSGENTAGKSTILDAIQLVLTTNTRKFNVAANEKGNRNLKGYVRCKIGNVGETYLRKNVVPANVALEFYEEKADRYFVIGVHMTSPDEESPVITKWYVQECRLENLSFIVENTRPALAEEFRVDGKKIRYIETARAARDYFKRRMGNLDDKFFDIIPKSLAFKPMDNVKEFINKFVLSETKIDVASLRENIETLSELEALLERSQKQYDALEQIMGTHEKIVKKDHDIAVNEILLALAGRDACKQEIEETEKDIRLKSQSVDSNKEQLTVLEQQLRDLEEQIIGINVAIQSNSSNKMVEDARRRIEDIQKEMQKLQEEERRLKEQARKLRLYMEELRKIDYSLLSSGELELLSSAESSEKKNEVIEKIESFQREHLEEIRNIRSRSQVEYEKLTDLINELQNRLRELEKRNLKYPEQTENLKFAIEKEFAKRGIRSKVYILSELLEITDPKWTDAVEGYFNQQKFYLIVEPEYYDIALEVYEKKRDQIHTAGIINTKKIPLEESVNNQSLAYVVKSENRYAKAYANYVLGRVIRCDSSKELEQYDIAITAQCMLYQGYVVRHINPKNYRNPYIGQNAYRVQIVNTRKELEEKSAERSQLREKIKLYSGVLEREKSFDLSLLKLFINAPAKLVTAKEQLETAKEDLERASNDPSLIELQIQLGAVEEQRKAVTKEEKLLRNENARLEVQIQNANVAVADGKNQLQGLEYNINQKEDADGLAYQEAEEKYKFNRKTKTAKKVAENFAPQRAQFENEKNGLVDQLKGLQQQFNLQFTQDFIVGLTGMAEYREAMQKLKSVEMIRYEEKLRQAKEDCEQIFKSDFLSKMKELIENAKAEFRNLNKALDHIYYGDDSYHFKLSFDKGKEGLYRMITSENNQEGINLWTAAFEAEYREEMTELFDKLMTKDDNGQKIVEEYTDYRSYLDYDIEIRKRDGSVQRFSDIYGEKSGSETQVPYYVAIAASFYQLYRYGNSVRLMLLDEAFDKMDDERIGSMLDFFNSLDLQVIMATPPAKIETIGEKVDTVLTAIRVGANSIVEEYDF